MWEAIVKVRQRPVRMQDCSGCSDDHRTQMLTSMDMSFNFKVFAPLEGTSYVHLEWGTHNNCSIALPYLLSIYPRVLDHRESHCYQSWSKAIAACQHERSRVIKIHSSSRAAHRNKYQFHPTIIRSLLAMHAMSLPYPPLAVRTLSSTHPGSCHGHESQQRSDGYEQ